MAPVPKLNYPLNRNLDSSNCYPFLSISEHGKLPETSVSLASYLHLPSSAPTNSRALGEMKSVV